MPPRPAFKVKQNRPLSAVYIGKGASPSLQDLAHSASGYVSLIDGTPPGLPDLPEPPSPSSSIGSVKSGLPSPPATNSTGSGSTGDPATIAIRERPLSHHSNSSASASSDGYHGVGTHMKRGSSSSDAGAEGDFDDDYDNDNDSNLDGDDNTARLDRKILASSSEKTSETLRRVKSLTQRNRMALDKLSRLSSPLPARSGSPSLASSTSSRYSSPPKRAPDPGRSGSETERESTRHSNTSSTHSSQSSSSRSHTRSVSASNYSPLISSSYLPSTTSPLPATPHHRNLRSSTPGSPRASTSSLTRSPTSRRRNRTSMANISQLQLTDFEEEEEDPGQKTATATTREKTLNERDLIVKSTLASASSSRSSPLGTRRRGALPMEFRSDMPGESPIPNTGNSRKFDTRSPEDVKRASWKHNTEPMTPFRQTNRSSTLHEPRRSAGPNPRWSSEDFRSPAIVRDRPYHNSLSNEDGNTPRRERRQSLRGGSVESALWSPGGRSLLGEGLRAAGLSRRKDDESRTESVSATAANGASDIFRERERRVEWSPHNVVDDSRSKTLSERAREKQPARAATSMAHYQYLDREDTSPREVPIKSHKNSYSLASTVVPRKDDQPAGLRQPTEERAASSMNRYNTKGVPPTPSLAPLLPTPAHLFDRLSTPSPFGTRRFTTSQSAQYSANSTQSQASEHNRLLLESLTSFENQIGKLPQMTSTAGTGASPAELAKNAQTVVFFAERLSGVLKNAGARAMEAQVEAEVEDASRDANAPMSVSDVWSKVALDYRESSRAADELVRGVTSLLLGFGRVVREYSASPSEFGSPALHGRHVSLGEDDHRRGGSPDIGRDGNSSTSGRRSVSSRHSWEPVSREMEREREEALRRLSGTASRSESVLARASPATFQKLRDRGKAQEALPDMPSTGGSFRKSLPAATGSGPSGSTRKLFTPREQRERLLDAKAAAAAGGGGSAGREVKMATLDSQETIHGQPYEPSPTPAPRPRPSLPERERTRTLTPLTIPKPLPTLPSETRRQLPASATATANPSLNTDQSMTARERERRRSTLRGSGVERPSFPSITTPINATTAVTPHTVSNTPDRTTGFSLQRTDSDRSSRSQVTFSRPTTVSVSVALTDIHQQHERRRTISNSSMNSAADADERPSAPHKAPVMALSELERDNRRKTLALKASRMSLKGDELERSGGGDGGRQLTTAGHAADRSAASTILDQSGGSRRGGRRIVTDIWPRE